MPLWLVEDPTTVYVILGLAALGLIAALLITRLAKFGIGVGIVLMLGLLVWLLDFLVVTDYEHVVDRLQFMAAKAEEPDFDAIFENVARDFHYLTMDKAGFRGHAESRLHRYKINELVLWDFKKDKVENGVAQVSFNMKIKGDWSTGAEFFLVRAELVKEEGKWKLKGFKLFNPLVETDQEIYVP